VWSLDSFSDIATAVTTACGAIAAVIGLHFKVVVPAAKNIRHLVEVVPKIDVIIAELTPNGGGSIKDRIRRIDESVRSMEYRHRFVQDCLDVGVYECDKDGMSVFCNEALCELFGLSLEETLGTGWLAAIVDEDRQRTWDIWQSATRAGIPYSHSYHVINQRSNERIKVRTKAYAVKMPNGEVASYQGTIWRDDDVDQILGTVARAGRKQGTEK
jgi:PAS domain S-box-containing protein